MSLTLGVSPRLLFPERSVLLPSLTLLNTESYRGFVSHGNLLVTICHIMKSSAVGNLLQIRLASWQRKLLDGVAWGIFTAFPIHFLLLK